MAKKILKWLVLFILLAAAGGYIYYRFFLYEPPLITNEDRQKITVMPLPASLKLTGDPFEVGYINVNTQNEPVESSVIGLLKSWNTKSLSGNTQLNIEYDTLVHTPYLGMNEAYTLNITSSRIDLKAPTSVGIIRGLETLKQLAIKDNGSLFLPYVEIEDKPRYDWRGLMIDVCRHWIPKDIILKNIDAMAAAKMNVLHLHLSEDQGFRVESNVFPGLHEIGSNGDYYTQADIREIVTYAASRGVRVIPEFDVPGHSKSWQIAYPELSSSNRPLRFGKQGGELFSPPLDPTREAVYEFLDRLIGEMSGLFPDEYFHIGGDEVNPDYWEQNPRISRFMDSLDMQSAHDLQRYFNDRLYKIVKKHGKKMIGWDEIINEDLPEDVTVQAWTSHKALFRAVQMGGTGILSTGLYLDHMLSAGEHYDVDPVILKGAVDIEPDTSHWKMFDHVMDIGGNRMESQLVIFDRDPDNVYGFFAMLSDRMVFKGGRIQDNILKFNMMGPVGELEYEAEIKGDSLKGEISMALLSFEASGKRTGGSDMPDSEMPEIEVVRPLTDAERARILGGEACQWSEFVDSLNITTRIWPRTAAIAEKLWSPLQLTDDVDDMYRRLHAFNAVLVANGIDVDSIYRTRLRSMISSEGFEPLKNIMDLMEEVKYHGRMPALLEADSLYLPEFQLNRLVDIARPESLEGRRFNKMAEEFSQAGKNKEELITVLRKWQDSAQKLSEYTEENKIISDITTVNSSLLAVSTETIRRLENKGSTMSDSVLFQHMAELESGDHGLVFSGYEGLQSILQSID